MFKKVFIVTALLFALQREGICQGCSDAGFCTIGSLQSSHADNKTYKNYFKFSGAYGLGEQRTNIYQFTPEINLSLFRNNLIQLKVPFLFINGNLGNTGGIGDLSLSITQTVKKTERLKFDLTLGTKLATGKTNAEENNLPLPMSYQTGLGTDDIILGAALKIKKWNFGAGYQGVLYNGNRNRFLHSSRPFDAAAQNYFESNLLDRGSDALIRAERKFNIPGIEFSAGVLAIYHLKESSFVNDAARKMSIRDSDGLTLNITGNAQYDLSKRTGISLSGGFPAVIRKVRPDGLTRDLVVSAGFNYNF